MRPTLPALACLFALLGVCRAVAADPPAKAALPPAANRTVDYARDVQPIFAAACYRCHGDKKQRSGFRLDLKAAALKGGDNGKAILPGDSTASPLIRYVAGLEDTVMPPSGPRLTAEQIGLLRAWIDQGAAWPEDAKGPERSTWWSLAPLVRPAVPRPDPGGAAWVRNPVDAFVLARLRDKGLRPSPEADRRTLIRRLSFDLLGLPPAPAEVEAFVADPDPRAYEKLVDRYLASPRHGERWARHWLDVVHFGETHGYDKDKPRAHAWPYRDYVIRAFNADKPYGRFVQEQVAGDVLFPGTTDGALALGFIAAGPWDFIGHAEVPETKIDGKVARHLDRDDMVSNTMNTFVSLTVQCAQCHNHKFDPILQEDYYSLQAVFAALDRADKPYDADPAVARQRSELTARQRELERRRQALDQQLKKLGGRELADLDAHIQAAGQAAAPKRRPEYGYHSGIEPAQDRVKWVQVDLGRSVAVEKVVAFGCDDDFNHIGAGFGFPVRFKVEIADDPHFKTGVQLIADHTGADVTNPGTVPQTLPAAGKKGRYVRVTATKLAPRQNDYIFALAELSVFDGTGKNLALGAAVTALDSIEALPRWSRKNLVDGIAPGQASPAGAVDVARLREQRQALLARVVDAATRQESEEVARETAKVRQELGKLPPPRLVYAGTVHSGGGAFTGTGPDGGRPRPIHILSRGNVQKPGREVGPGALSLFPDLPGRFDLNRDRPEGERRAALARWLTDRSNPLTWRSIVNRVWLYHFGRGLVDSPNDFGRMGQLPTHPELLDWLAVELRDRGQSLKQLHRLLVTSATYRQSSAIEAKAAVVDANNLYYGRMNRRRLEAEAIRDSILWASGTLDDRMYGPSFQDFVIEKPEHSPHYEYHLHDPEDPKAHRRSVYRFLVRSQQQPFMATMDCADPSMLVDKRNQTITPLQALALLNDQLTVVMAKHFAARVARSGDDLETQVRTAFRLALGRVPAAAEQRELTDYARQYGLANTCRVILNLNEFVFVD
jgi:mono/diheme cytochrome c family protein